MQNLTNFKLDMYQLRSLSEKVWVMCSYSLKSSGGGLSMTDLQVFFSVGVGRLIRSSKLHFFYVSPHSHDSTNSDFWMENFRKSIHHPPCTLYNPPCTCTMVLVPTTVPCSFNTKYLSDWLSVYSSSYISLYLHHRFSPIYHAQTVLLPSLINRLLTVLVQYGILPPSNLPILSIGHK